MSVIAARGAAVGARGNASLALTWGLALFLLFNALALNGVLRLASPDYYRETVLNHTSDVLLAEGCDDSWGIMAFALKYAQSPHTTPLYTEIFFNQRLKFQYPPSSLFAIAGMLWLGGPELVRTAECPDFAPASLNDVLGWLFILMSAVSAAVLLERGLRQTLPAPSSGGLMAARAALVLALALTFYPIVKAFTLGQIQIWLNGLFALSLLCWATGWKATSGLLIGLMCLVKPHYGLFVLWAALRREWRFMVACVTAGVVGLIASIATFGWNASSRLSLSMARRRSVMISSRRRCSPSLPARKRPIRSRESVASCNAISARRIISSAALPSSGLVHRPAMTCSSTSIWPSVSGSRTTSMIDAAIRGADSME